MDYAPLVVGRCTGRRGKVTAMKVIVGALLAGSLIFGSTAAAAAPTIPAAQPSPWAVLTVMSEGAPAAAICGAAAAAAAAQAPAGCVLPALDAPPPVPQAAPAPPAPVPPISAPSAGLGLGISPLLLGLLVVAAGVGIYFAVHHHGNSPT